MTPEMKLIARMGEIIADRSHPLMAAAIGVIKDGNILFSDAVGSKQLGGDAATGDTKFRIASISKLITATGVWQLIEQGLVDPDGDASRYVGFQLRNPHHPDTPITVKMLLSHTSSIRDGGKPGSYNIPYGHHISEFFTEGMPHYMPRGWAPAGEAPGVFFAYSNMNYCLLGSVIETVSGERFDRYMTNHVFAPMGLTCSFHVAEMPENVQGQVGTLYRKLDSAGEYDPANGVWTPQCDDFSQGYPRVDYSGYVLGSNGSVIPLFKKQIAKGGPVTVTHPEIIRFFMTIPEACRLVMEAATMSKGNQIFVFDMGESVKIDTLARRMITLAGFVPDRDIMVEYSGLRPGEKLYEEVLSNAENTLPTSHDRIRIAKVREYEYEKANEVIKQLEDLSLRVIIPDMVILMKETVPEFISKNSRYEQYDIKTE